MIVSQRVALDRLNVPDKTLKVLEAFYVNPRLRIKDREGEQEPSSTGQCPELTKVNSCEFWAVYSVVNSLGGYIF